ncbi:hypothetical protein BGW38_002885 [Lunasporangiospora selenospora]|uniref:Glucosidase II beta subunit N-terminal domain-containing protein n=1 Tax=Lunasporangiospora selenospora TaxID=979761 RepID=A0A9P6KD83_9FUNG|nr:hypothetical protein BGW38_002885 [Lunasporangiospora selenospora]
MKTRGLCFPILVTMALSLVNADRPKASSDNMRGIAPSMAKQYTPDNAGNWKCLDGSKTIAFSAINDDYCDCPDGSDEPGMY